MIRVFCGKFLHHLSPLFTLHFKLRKSIFFQCGNPLQTLAARPHYRTESSHQMVAGKVRPSWQSQMQMSTSWSLRHACVHVFFSESHNVWPQAIATLPRRTDCQNKVLTILFCKRPGALARTSCKRPENTSTGMYFGKSPCSAGALGRAGVALTRPENNLVQIDLGKSTIKLFKNKFSCQYVFWSGRAGCFDRELLSGPLRPCLLKK